MKMIIWVDERGYKQRSYVPDNADDKEAKFGIPAGPPDIDQIDWDAVKREISHVLAFNELWSFDEVQRSPNGVVSAINVLKRHLLQLYREDYKQRKS